MAAPDDDSRRTLRVLVADERGRSLRAGALTSWLRRVAPAAAQGTVSIALVSTRRIRALNRTYRQKDSATDVLSFPAARPGGRTNVPEAGRARRPGKTLLKSRDASRRLAASVLGDIVIARDVAKRQAREAGHSETTELRVLALHGLLHLLGYDHECDSGTMERIERRLRRKGGLREGLIERAGSGRRSAARRAQAISPLEPGSVSGKQEHPPGRPASPAKNSPDSKITARVARLLGARSALLGRAPRAARR
jgi:probable rRNA maturation factor